MFTLVIFTIVASNQLITIEAFAAVNRRFCETSSDCASNQCCADTPIGYKLCLEHEKPGEICLFRSRTPVSVQPTTSYCESESETIHSQ